MKKAQDVSWAFSFFLNLDNNEFPTIKQREANVLILSKNQTSSSKKNIMSTITVKTIPTEVKALKVNIALNEQGDALIDNGSAFVPSTPELKQHLEEISELVGPAQNLQIVSKSQIKIQSGIILNNGQWIVKDEDKNSVIFLTDEDFKAKYDYQEPEPAAEEEDPNLGNQQPGA